MKDIVYDHGSAEAAMAKVRACLPGTGTAIVDPQSLHVYSPSGQTGSAAPSPEGLRVAVLSTKEGAWAAGVSADVNRDIHKGDRIFAAFFVRVVHGCDGQASGLISEAGVQLNHPPWTILAGSGTIVAAGTWTLFYTSGNADLDVPAGQAVLQVQVGGCRQTLEFGPVVALNLGQGVSAASMPANETDYPNRSAAAGWRQAALSRIESVRKGTIHIAVRDANGHPVPGAQIHVALLRHEFHFGGFAGPLIAENGGDRARDAFVANFNFATAPVYWTDWGWQTPEARSRYLTLAHWLRQNDYAWRAHPILYPARAAVPAYIRRLSGDRSAVQQAVIGHVADVFSALSPDAPTSADIVNEPREGHYLEEIAGPEIFSLAFAQAAQVAPAVVAFANENNILENGGFNSDDIGRYLDWLTAMRSKGVRIGGIGIQGHFKAPLTDPVRILSVLDRFSSFGLPIELTEFDVDTPDEAALADYTRDVLIAAFSHPAVVGVVAWGWGDLTKNGAMFRSDWSKKPNAIVWDEWVHHRWWTDAQLVSSPGGRAEIRAFYGDYAITATWNGQSVVRRTRFDETTSEIIVQ